MIIGTGIDIVETSRIEKAFKKMGWAFAHRVLGKKEIEVFGEVLKDDTMFNKPSSSYLARRFAAKEAFIKALNWPTVDIREVQILNTESGRPYFSLTGKAWEIVETREWNTHLSISDTDNNVVASVIIEKGESKWN